MALASRSRQRSTALSLCSRRLRVGDDVSAVFANSLSRGPGTAREGSQKTVTKEIAPSLCFVETSCQGQMTYIAISLFGYIAI